MDSAAQVLFGKTRQAVLALLLERPEDSYYLRQMCQLSGISPGAMQAELRQLTRAGLLERAKDGNRVAYRANARHPVFESLRELVRKTCGVPALLAAALRPFADEISFAALYGSLAKGKSHGRSDVDVLIVGRLPLDRALAALVPLEEQFGREISVRVFSPEELERRMSEGDSFVRGLMHGPMITLAGQRPDQ